MNTKDFLLQVEDFAGLTSVNEAQDATYIVLNLLSHRILPHEAKDVESQLPKDMKKLWNDDNEVQKWFKKAFHHVSYNYKTPEEFYDLVQKQLDEDHIQAAAPEVVRAVLSALKSAVSPGEINDIMAELPDDLRVLIAEA